MASKRKKGLPVSYPSTKVAVNPTDDKEWQERERKYKAEEGLRTLQRA